jgi:beta-galactosidase
MPSTRQGLAITTPKLWSPDAPHLYQLVAELRQNGEVIDSRRLSFGIRIVTFDASEGMKVNGVATKLRGGCVHHDNGLLGSAAFRDADDRRVRLMKARGYNAIRTAHNLCSASFADACDRQGVFLIVEAFDCWQVAKTPQGYSTWFDDHWREDLAATVMSTRNHPSVIMWSIGNEIPYRSTDSGLKIQWQLANEVHRLDPTRPVTAGVNGLNGDLVVPDADTARPGFAHVPDESAIVFLDIAGQNYRHYMYDKDHAAFPNRVTYGSESFAKDVMHIWADIEKRPYIIGDFVWTAMDYLGEAGLGCVYQGPPAFGGTATVAWPWVGAYCGDIDLIGGQKPQSLARDVAWGLAPMHLVVQKPVPVGKAENVSLWGWSDEFQSWTWPGFENQPILGRVYTLGDRADIYHNGVRVETKTLSAADFGRAEFKLTYAPGTLEAVAFKNGKEIGRKRLTTNGAAAALRLTPEAAKIASGRDRLAFVQVDVTDTQGHSVADAMINVKLALSGPAELVGFGSGDPIARGSYQAPTALTYRGKALAIIRPTGRGKIQLEASGDGVKPAATTIAAV